MMNKLKVELETLKAILAKYAKTEDGVTIYPGMAVWILYDGMVVKTMVRSVPQKIYERAFSTLQTANLALEADKKAALKRRQHVDGWEYEVFLRGI